MKVTEFIKWLEQQDPEAEIEVLEPDETEQGNHVFTPCILGIHTVAFTDSYGKPRISIGEL